MDAQVKRFIKAVDRFNEDFKKYADVSGDFQLPYIDGTIDGWSECQLWDYKTAGTTVTFSDCDGFSYEVISEWDCQLDEAKDALKYDKRRLAKAWRIWKSDNPDRELGKDDDE